MKSHGPTAIHWIGALAAYAALIGTITVIFWLLLIDLASAAPQTRTIKKDLGGVIDKYVDAYEAHAKRGTHYKIDGPCASACTVILGIIPNERVCVTEKATLGFHSGYKWWFGFRQHSSTATQKMWTYYPPQVQADLVTTYYWDGGAGQKHLNMIWVKASRYYPLCGQK